MAEIHNEVLRNSLHKCQTQLAAEGIEIKFAHVLAEAVYSKNALLTIGEGTPYIAVLGRVLPFLPQIEHIVGTAHLNDEAGVEGLLAFARRCGFSTAGQLDRIDEFRRRDFVLACAETFFCPRSGDPWLQGRGDIPD